MGRIVSDDVLAVLTDPYETMTRMELKHRETRVVQFTSDLWTPEQAMLLDDWWDPKAKAIKHRDTVIAKGRNQGVGEITQKFMTWFAMQCPDPMDMALLAHAEPTRDRHINRYFENGMGLPAAIRPVTSNKTNEKWVWKNGTAFVGMTQGGKTGKGQGFTFTQAHMTECGMYTPAEDAIETIGSIKATMHESSPYYFIVKESTSSGPATWWQDEVSRAERDPDTNFRFFPWAVNPSFRIPFKTPQERLEFSASLTPDEIEAQNLYDNYLTNLARTHPHNVQWIGKRYPECLSLSLEALRWRRKKLHGDYGGVRFLFAHDYPMTVAEAFLSGGTGWFDPELLSAMRFKAVKGERTREGVEVWRRPAPDCRYAVGVDIGEGVGGDYSVISVVDHQLRQCAVWSDNRTPPEQVGELAVRIAAGYHNALLLIESNKAGAEAIRAARRLGYGNFYMEKSVTGVAKDWMTKGNQFSSNKEMLYGHARTQMNAKRVEVNDPLTVDELTNIGLDRKGSINGRDKKHDDRAMAWVLAVWAARRIEKWHVDLHEEVNKAFGLSDAPEMRATLPFARGGW